MAETPARDLVKRLTDSAGFEVGLLQAELREAASEISRLRSELEKAREDVAAKILQLIDDTHLACRQNALLLDGENGIRSEAAADALQSLSDTVREVLASSPPVPTPTDRPPFESAGLRGAKIVANRELGFEKKKD